MTNSDETSRRSLLVMLLAALVLVLAVFRPLGGALFIAAVMAMVLWPVHHWLSRHLKNRRSLAASIVVALVVLIILGPLVWMSAFVVAESVDAVRFVAGTVQSEGTRGLIAKLPDSMEQTVYKLIERLPMDVNEITAALQDKATEAGGTAAAVVGAAVTGAGTVLFQGTIMVLALFFFLVNKEDLLDWMDAASPLKRGQTRELFAEFVRVCQSVIVSTSQTSLLQAIVAMVGYLVLGVPHPFFFFALTFFIAFIPAVGAGSVACLAALILLVTGNPWKALILAVHGVVVVGLVDNVAKPFLMKDNIKMHGAVVFFALIGGLAAFGAMGLLIGPLAVALFLAMLRMWQRDYSNDPSERQAMIDQNVGKGRLPKKHDSSKASSTNPGLQPGASKSTLPSGEKAVADMTAEGAPPLPPKPQP